MMANKKVTAKLIIEKNLPLKNEGKNVPEEAIDELLNLTHVRLDRIGITHIANLDCLTKITNLYLQHNSIKKLENLDILPNLKFLCVAHNQISVLEGIKDLTRLGFFDISNNLLTEVDLNELPKSLIILDLRENEIKCEAKKFAEILPNLKQLNGIDVDDQEETDSEDEEESSSEEELKEEKLQNVSLIDALDINADVGALHESRMTSLHDELFELQTPRSSMVFSETPCPKDADSDSDFITFDDVKVEIENDVESLKEKMKSVELEVKNCFDIRDTELSIARYSADDFITKYHENERERLLSELQEKLKQDFAERELILEEYSNKNETNELKPIDDVLSPKTYRDTASDSKGQEYTIVPMPYKSPPDDRTFTPPKRRARSAGQYKLKLKKPQGTGLFSRPLLLENSVSEIDVKSRNKRRPLNYDYKKKTKANLRTFSQISTNESNEEIMNLHSRIPMPPVEAKKLSILPKIHRQRSLPTTPVVAPDIILNHRIRAPGARPIERHLTNAFEIPH